MLWDNFSELDTIYKGVDLRINKRLADRWMLSGERKLRQKRGGYVSPGDLNNPNFQFRNGRRRHGCAVDAQGVWRFTKPRTASWSRPTVQSYAGSPESTTVQVGSNTVALTQVNQSIQVEPRGETRTPSLTLADMSFRKVFRIEQRTIEPVFEIHNLMNVGTVQSRNIVSRSGLRPGREHLARPHAEIRCRT